MERLQPDTLEEAKDWLKMLREQLDDARTTIHTERNSYVESCGKLQGQLAALLPQLKREQEIVDRLLARDMDRY